MAKPQVKVVVTHAATDYTFENNRAAWIEVWRRENGWDVATVRLAEKNSDIYSSKLDEDDDVEILVKEGGAALYTTLFDGKANVVLPELSELGEFVTAKCDGAGYGLANMLVGEEFGTQSTNPTQDKIQEIVTGATTGILDKWVAKILGSATDSGYSYTDVIEDIAGSLRYLYFPYKPADKALNDACELLQAIKGAAAGPHWIVTPGSEVLLTTVANHHAAAVAAGWTTYYGGSAAASTVVQGVDFVAYKFQKLAPEANYILYHGRLRKPATENWTENNSGSWRVVETLGTGDSAISDDSDAADHLIGDYSVDCLSETGIGGGAQFQYPDPTATTLNLDLEKISGEYAIPTLTFFCKVNGEVLLSAGNTPVLYMYTGGAASADRFAYTFGGFLQANKWMEVNLPVGPYAKMYPYHGTDLVASKINNADWADIDWFSFDIANSAALAGEMWIDGLTINGWVLRVAKQTAGYSAADPVKMKIVTDTVGKDDLLRSGTPGTTDLGTIAQLCKAEYYRAKSTPIVGQFTTPLIKDLWPGMLMHVHAGEKTDATYNIDADFRVTKLRHLISEAGCFTTVYVTDDVINSHPRSAYNEMNKVLAASRPEFQDQQATSFKARDIDFTLPLLEESY